jgi:putative NIF3 family GTP cyclohydrolase 1 type 2
MYRQDIQERLVKIFSGTILESYSDEWDIRFPNREFDISRVGWAASLTPDVIQQCINNDLDLVVTHHDAWKWLYEFHDKTIEMLQANKIGHIFVHAPLDQADFGTSATILESLGISKTEPFCKENGIDWGRIGDLSKPITFKELESKLVSFTGEEPRYRATGKTTPKRIAAVAGGGYNTGYVQEAVQKGCDTYITGEYNCWLALYIEYLELNCMVFSHTYTERQAAKRLAEMIFSDNRNIEIIEMTEPHI